MLARKIWAIWGLVWCCGVTGTEYIVRTLPEKLAHGDLTFAVTFDNWTVNADKAGGNSVSTTMGDVGLKIRGEIGFDGQQAFRPLPGEDLKFEVVGNVNPHEGSMSVWSKLDYNPADYPKSRGNTSLAGLYFEEGKEHIRFNLYVFRGDIVVEWWSSAPPANHTGMSRVMGPLKGIGKGQWFQVVATWRGDRLALYVNGEPIGETRLKPKYLMTASLKPDNRKSFIAVKNRFYEDVHQWAIPVDDFMLYSRELSGIEIRRDYLALLKDKGDKVALDYEVALHGVLTDKVSRLDRLEAEFDLSSLPNEYARLLGEGALKVSYVLSCPGGKRREGDWTFGKKTECRYFDGITEAGDYLLSTTLDGRKFHTAKTHRPDLSFAYNGIGRYDDIPAVFQGFSVAGRTVRLWNREYQFGDGPLPESITIGGRELFAAPPALLVNGSAPRWTDGRTDVTRKHVTYAGIGEIDGGLIEYSTKVDFDGMVLFRWMVKGRPVIREMELQWRVRREFCDCLMTPQVEQEPREEFALLFPNAVPRGTLLWFASEKKGGFAYSMLDDGNWLYDPSRPVLFANRGTGLCRVAMIGGKGDVRMPEDVPYSACFIATPTRPYPPKIRAIRYGDLSKRKYQRFGFTMNAGLDGIFTFAPHPTDFEYRMRNFPPNAYTCYGAADSLTEASDIARYFRKYADRPGSTVYKMNALLPTDVPGKYTKTAFNTVAFCGRTQIIYDYYLYNQERMFRHPYGDRVACINYDLIGNGQCGNPLHGCGFTDRFGRSISSFTLLCKRELAMRTLAFVHANNRTLDLHCQNLFSPFIHGMCDTWSTGEQLDAVCNRDLFGYTDLVPEIVYRTEFNRDLLGVRVIASPQLSQAGRGFVHRDENIFYSEAMLSEFLVHDIEFQAIWMHQAPARKVWDIYEKYRMGDPSVKCWRYYEEGNPARSLVPEIRVTTYRTPRAHLLVVSNGHKEHCEAVIDVSLLRRQGETFAEEYANAEIKEDGEGRLKLKLPPRSFRLLVAPRCGFYPFVDSFERSWEISAPSDSDTMFRLDLAVGNPAPPSLLYVRGPSGRLAGAFFDTFPVAPGGRYALSWKVLPEGSEFVAVEVFGLDDRGVTLKGVRQFPLARFPLKAGWQELTLPVDIPDEGGWRECRLIRVRLSVAGRNSRTWIDDFRMAVRE
ncbi:MAG: hypothetical protein IJJ33_07505 [Victivallales bacterium]|nr:hypothetical protein [Victivallales bacterium]